MKEMLHLCNFLDSSLQLRRKHTYYAQVQLLMLVLNLNYCDFIVFSSSCKQYFKLEIPFDATFCKDLSSKLKNIYFNHMLHVLCN